MDQETITYDLPQMLLPPDETVVVTSAKVSNQGPIYPLGIVLHPTTARNVTITDVMIGKNSQLFSCESIPGSIFEQGKRPFNFHMDSVPPGLTFSLKVQNLSESPVWFRGSVVAQKTKPPIRPYLVGFGRVRVGPDDSSLLVTTIQIPSRPVRLLIPDHLLGDFTVESLSSEKFLDVKGVNKAPSHQLTRENLIADGPTDLEPVPTIPRYSDIILTVKNLTTTKKFFEAALLTHYVEEHAQD